MIEILIVSHANMATGLHSSIELILGPMPNVHSMGLFAEDSFDTFNEKIQAKLDELKNDDGVLMFVDLFGGTPCNVSALNINKEVDGVMPKVECVSGMNLPMVIEAISMRDSMDLNELKDYVMDVGCQGVKDIRHEFNLSE